MGGMEWLAFDTYYGKIVDSLLALNENCRMGMVVWHKNAAIGLHEKNFQTERNGFADVAFVFGNLVWAQHQ